MNISDHVLEIFYDTIEFPYENVHTHYNLTDYEVHVLYHPNVPQSQAGEVYFDRTRIGWIFPLIRIESDEAVLEDQSSQEYLVKHMEIAAKLLSINTWDLINFRLLESGSSEKIKLSSIIGDKVVIFVESKISSQQTPFSFNKAYPSFLLRYNLSTKEWDSGNPKPLDFNNIVKLTTVSDYLEEDSFVVTTFPTLYESSLDNEFLKFTLLYQVIEYFIDKILYPSLNRQMRRNLDAHKLKKQLSEITTESERIKILFNECVNVKGNIKDLFEDALVEFNRHLYGQSELEEIEGNTAQTTNGVHKRVYYFRNTIYHNFRSINREFLTDGCLSKINNCFELLIEQLFLDYSELSFQDSQ